MTRASSSPAAAGAPLVKCYPKVAGGALWPLRCAFVFGPRLLIIVLYESIVRVAS